MNIINFKETVSGQKIITSLEYSGTYKEQPGTRPPNVEISTNSKKRLPSGSPDGKDDDSHQTESNDSYDNAVEGVEAEEQSKANWRVYMY